MRRALWGRVRRARGMSTRTLWKTWMGPPPGLLFGLTMATCGGDGGGGDSCRRGAGSPAAEAAGIIDGVVVDGTPRSPIAQAHCRFVAQSDGQQGGVSALADTAGHFTLPIPPQAQGWIECQHPLLATLTLRTFVSTEGAAAGTTMTVEVSPAS